MRKSLNSNTGLFILVILIFIPFFLWLPYSDFSTTRTFLLSLGQICALIGFTLYLINFILSSRFKILDKIFAGINRMYISHHLWGVSAFILLLLHPVFISLSYLTTSVSSAFNFVLPSLNNLPQFYGSLALSVTIVLLVITLYVNIDYDKWKITHKFLGLGLLFAGLHILFIGSTLAKSQPLRLYFYLLALLALISYIRKTILGRYLVKRRKFVINKVEISGEIMKIMMTASNGPKFFHEPGQFVFVEFARQGVPYQSHPFSITSSSNEAGLSLGIKLLGDYTKSLNLLKKGDLALVEGPYGRFGYSFFPNPKQIWIAGGIGMTPFVSMAKSLPTKIRTVLYYCVSELPEAVYYNELIQVEKAKDNFKVIVWDSKSKGRFTIGGIERLVEPDVEFFICGPPPMMKSLKQQLIEAKIAEDKIHTEEFSLS